MLMLKQFRVSKRYTQKEMATMLNLNLNTYRGYELGKRCLPYKVLANFLEIRGYEDDLKLAKILREIEG